MSDEDFQYLCLQCGTSAEQRQSRINTLYLKCPTCRITANINPRIIREEPPKAIWGFCRKSET